MQQLTQKLKNGDMKVLEVPLPSLASGCVLVQNHYSLISAGTEGSTVKTARGSLLAKAQERPQQVKQVFDTLRSQGVTQTYRAVMKKLDAYSPLGYSTAGEVVEVAEDVRDFVVGDLVACAGLSACHAEYVSVPVKLCVKLQPDADLKQAAYNTLGAIAMQGVRQADLRLGENCAIIGMGLLGQLTALILRASGVYVIGVDIDPVMIETASKKCLDLGLLRDDPGIEGKIHNATGGLGCDAVIITAASSSVDPINFAGAIARKRGTVVVVGAVPTGFERDPYYYRKELQVRMSCSYGPGRYDPDYEEKGNDYPAAYIRWTENRNMQAFQNLLYRKAIDLEYLTTHTFKLAEAESAYDMMMEKKTPFVGIIIEYDKQEHCREVKPVNLLSSKYPKKAVPAGIGFIGAGSYAQSHLLPNIPKDPRISLVGLMTGTGAGSRSVGDRFKFAFCSSSASDIIFNDKITTIFVASRHDSHASYLLQALPRGKHTFIEKPLCLTERELNIISVARNEFLKQFETSQPILMVGYNRRFSVLSEMVRDALGTGPMAMVYRINAGSIPPDSWIQNPLVGGGRIIGEVCHFVDYLTFINGSLPVSVYASAMTVPGNLNDTVTIDLKFRNGSVGSICYFANGDKSCPKERIEIYANNCTVVLNDFKAVSIYAKGKKKEKKLAGQDKGQAACVHAFLDAVIEGLDSPIPFEEIYSASLVTFKIMESLATGRAVSLINTFKTETGTLQEIKQSF